MDGEQASGAESAAAKSGAIHRLREFFEANLGRVVHTSELAKVAGIHSYARRIRELRMEEGMQILTYHDTAELKPGEYKLVSLDRVPRVSHRIDAAVRARVLERDGFTCQICGAGAGDPDPLDERRPVRLHVDHIDPNGATEEANLRTLCSACNEGRSNLHLPRSTVNLLAAVRRAPASDQKEALAWLQRKFGGQAE